MIKYLQSKKGFTLIELIVVIAILAVLMAVVLPMIGSRRAKITEANSTATDFYAAVQYVFTKYSMYEGPLALEYDEGVGGNPKLGIMRFYQGMSGNYPYVKVPPTSIDDAENSPVPASVYIELVAKNGAIEFVNCYAVKHSNATAYEQAIYYMRMTQRTSDEFKAFNDLMKSELDGRIKYKDGYYLAKVSYTYTEEDPYAVPSKMSASSLKVEYAAYTKDDLPDGGDFATYQLENLFFIEPNILANGEICGTCSKLYDSTDPYYNPTYPSSKKDPFVTSHTDILNNYVGMNGTYLF